MFRARSLRLFPLLAVLAACADDPTGAPPPEPAPPAKVLGVYEITLTGLGTDDIQSTAGPAQLRSADGPSFTLTPYNSGIALDLVSSSSFTEGVRGQGGHRYINVTYRVRNSTGATRNNLTFIPNISSSTIPGTPFTSLVLFNGTAADPSVAAQMVPTGAAALGGGTAMRATDVDVLQVFDESELTSVPLPAGVTGLMPYGFVVRAVNSTTNRTIPNAATANDYGGLVTLAFRYPLTASANADPYSTAFQILVVEDSETRMTESIEEGQDSSAVRRIRERAASLGATTVTVLPGSTAAASDVPDYPGQRQLCSVRTSGTAASPTRYITSAAAYTHINMLRPGESTSACGARFRSGTPSVATPGSPYSVTLAAMDRYGNVRTVVDSIQIERVAGPTATLGARAALVSGLATVQLNYAGLGSSSLRAVGRRVQTDHTVEVGAPTVALHLGTRQAALAGAAAPTRPAVVVRDGAGNVLPGRTVTFRVTAGGGTVTGGTAVTDANGIASVGDWYLGSTPNLNTLTATVNGPGVVNNPVSFNAAGCKAGAASGYGITLCINSTMTVSQRAAFENAVTRWQGLITGDLADGAVNAAANACAAGTPAINTTVDDLLIIATVESIDGPGGVLGSAGPCMVRNNWLPVMGMMRFDAADVASMEANGSYTPVILHEMGHVLGVGSLWPYLSLLQNPSSNTSALDTYFSGANGLAGFNAIGGSTYTGGSKVPVENTGGAGTINGHWRESVLANELMTGYINAGSNPLSQLTVRSLADLGYTVNVAGADPFFLTLSLRANAAQPGVQLLNDVSTGPIFQVDAQGRTTTRIR
ncbi:leishmanolysin-related zinc metalloendopeptidase [Longimicrobium sp.]|uniref:leishmanolysin-related zinc metalloendopeptidase n=1 Tax=Longimicrobium sp. TaxID=2029185 RepID=UPI003B3BC608